MGGRFDFPGCLRGKRATRAGHMPETVGSALKNVAGEIQKAYCGTHSCDP